MLNFLVAPFLEHTMSNLTMYELSRGEFYNIIVGYNEKGQLSYYEIHSDHIIITLDMTKSLKGNKNTDELKNIVINKYGSDMGIIFDDVIETKGSLYKICDIVFFKEENITIKLSTIDESLPDIYLEYGNQVPPLIEDEKVLDERTFFKTDNCFFI